MTTTNRTLGERSQDFKDYLERSRLNYVNINSYNFKGKDYMVFNPPYDYYNIFTTNELTIVSYKSFTWMVSVLYHLNRDAIRLDNRILFNAAQFASETLVKYVSILPNYVDNLVEGIIDRDEIPTPQPRHIIFNPLTTLSRNDKLMIVGKHAPSRKKTFSADKIEEVIELMMTYKKKITFSEVAKTLGCSTKTIQRNLSEELKKHIENYNKSR